MAQEFEQQADAFGARGALLGLDIGEKTIGVASCPADRTVATPVETIRRAKLTRDAERLAELASERGVVGLVVGLPLHMTGEESRRTQSTRAIAGRLRQFLDLPVAFWDERLSTAAMERDLIALDVSRARRREQIDASAAAFILQGAIDRLRARGSA
ncbi:MAG: Holliday junction resolvase RuvX [Pseudomonadota bacterium]